MVSNGLKILALLLVLFSCGSVRERANSGQGADKHVFILNATINTHKPHCGGMAPTERTRYGVTSPVSNGEFYLYRGTSRPEDTNRLRPVKTDENGQFSVELAEGAYQMIRAHKLLSLEAFIAANTYDHPHYEVRPEACFEAWKNTPDFSFTIVSDTTMILTEQHKCFTEANPCLIYIGPHPP